MNALKKCIFQTHLSLLLDFHNLSASFFDFWIKNCDSTVESDASLLRISIYIYGGEVRWSWKSFRSIWSGIWHSLDILSLSLFLFLYPFSILYFSPLEKLFMQVIFIYHILQLCHAILFNCTLLNSSASLFFYLFIHLSLILDDDLLYYVEFYGVERIHGRFF